MTPEERAQRILYRAKNTPSEYTTWDSFRDSVRDDLRAAEAEARREEWGACAELAETMDAELAWGDEIAKAIRARGSDAAKRA